MPELNPGSLPPAKAGVPWRQAPLDEWSIVNHYRHNGAKWLFVAMVRNGHCIQAEGPDTAMLWDELRHKAEWGCR